MTDPMSPSWAAPEGDTPLGAPVPAAPAPAGTPAPAPSPVQPATPKKKGNTSNLLLGLAAIVAVGGLAFAIGRTTAPASASTGFGRTGQALLGQGGPTGSFDPGSAPGGMGGLGDRTMTLTGTVASLDGTTMTLTTQGGQTVTVSLADTTYHAQAPATGADVTTGSSVQVSVAGFGGGMRPDASAAPAASGDPLASSLSATDVTIVSK
jgi:hypothetical protein